MSPLEARFSPSPHYTNGGNDNLNVLKEENKLFYRTAK